MQQILIKVANWQLKSRQLATSWAISILARHFFFFFFFNAILYNLKVFYTLLRLN